MADRVRHRAAASCDYCKKKRSRCVRLAEGPCENCAANKVPCESKALRKQRVYGSVESLSQRFRALDALVSGLFPGQDTRTLDGLYALAAARGITLPARGDVSPAQGVFAAPPPPSRIDPTPATSTLSSEKLVPTASGVGHYVGPSSSFRFIGAIRRLLGSYELLGHSPLRQEFTALRSSVALEQGNSDIPFTPPSPRPERPSSEVRFPALPPREVSDSLVRLFFEHLHPYYPLFLRPVFQLQYEALWETSSELGSSVASTELGWLCCLAMVVVLGTRGAGSADDAFVDLRERYLSFVRSSLGQLVASASLINLQALLLLQLYEHNSGQRNASWIFLGCASRMAIALGMHLESANQSCSDADECTARVRTWWTLYQFERNLCVMLGRPSSIDDLEMTLLPPDASSDTDMPLRYAESSVRLCKMQSAVRQSHFSPPESDALPPIQATQLALSDLQSWFTDLPMHLRPGWRSMVPQQRRANLLLQIGYENMIILVTRPYLLRQIKQAVSKQPTPSADRGMTDTCLASAERLLSYLQTLADENLLDTINWLDAYYVYLGVIVLSLDLLSPTSGDSAVRSRRKDTIRTIFESLRQTYLAPTYRILVKIAHQFASISGALASEVDMTLGNAADPITSDEGFSQWLLESLAPSGLDSFDMGAYTGIGLESFMPNEGAFLPHGLLYDHASSQHPWSS